MYPAVVHKITIKEKHSRLAEARVSLAGSEIKQGLSGGVKGIRYGFREGYQSAKSGINEFQHGSKRKGARYMMSAFGRAGEGTALSTVPVVGGFGAAIYSGGKGVRHAFSSVKASPKAESSTPLYDVIQNAHNIKKKAPVGEKTNMFVNDYINFRGQPSSSKPSQNPANAGRGQY